MPRLGHNQALAIGGSRGQFAAALRRWATVLALGVFLSVSTGFAEVLHLSLSAPDHHTDECAYCIVLLSAKAGTVAGTSATPVVECAVRSDPPAPSPLPLAPRDHEPLAPRAPPGR